MMLETLSQRVLIDIPLDVDALSISIPRCGETLCETVIFRTLWCGHADTIMYGHFSKKTFTYYGDISMIMVASPLSPPRVLVL